MKKVLFIVSIVVLVTAAGILHAMVIGDINNDGKVGLEEVIFALQVTARIKTQKTENFPALACYRFDETTGSKAFDSTVNQRNGTINGASRVTGKVGNALMFGPYGSYVELPAQGAFQSGMITIQAWIKPSQVNTNSTYQIVGSGSYGILSYKLQIHQGRLAFLLHKQPWQTVIVSNQVLLPDQWYHVAVAFNGSEARTYINGVEDNFRSVAFSIPDCINVLYVGTGADWSDQFYGIIDELTIYTYERTADQISSYYQETR